MAGTLLFSAITDSFAQVNVWQERRDALSRSRSRDQGALQLTSVPTPRTASSSSGFLGSLPAIRSLPLSAATERSLRVGSASNSAGLRSLLESLPSNAVSVRNLVLPNGLPSRGTVLFFQDIHAHEEAQHNIGSALGELIRKAGVGVVGLEGAFGPVDVSSFRSLPEQDIVRDVAGFLFRHKKISGPIHTAFTLPQDLPPFVGVDDPEHYQRNVEAYRTSAPRMDWVKQQLKARETEVRRKEAQIFGPELSVFNERIRAHRDGKSTLTEHIQLLANAVPGLSPASQVKVFQSAVEIEKTLDFNALEKERARLIESLTGKLSEAERDTLISQTVAHRLGRLTHGGFYRLLVELCRKKGVPLSRFAGMPDYVHYTLLYDQLDADRLYEEVNRLERETFDRLARTPEERNLVKEARILYLQGKLAAFSLTPEEWKEYAEMSRHAAPVMKSFEDFYREALKRNDALVENFLEAMDASKTNVGVLVAGGFHAPDIIDRLRRSRLAVISLVPRITKADAASGSAYLSVFAQEKEPLERLYDADRLFVAPEVFSHSARREAALSIVGAKALRTPGDIPGTLANDWLHEISPITAGEVVVEGVKKADSHVTVIVASKETRRRAQITLGFVNGRIASARQVALRSRWETWEKLGRWLAPLSWVEEGVHLLAAKLAGMEVTKVAGNYIEAPFLSQHPTYWKTLVVIASAPVFWLGMTLMSGMLGFNAIGLGEIGSNIIPLVVAILLGLPGGIMVLFHVTQSGNQHSDLNRIAQILKVWFGDPLHPSWLSSNVYSPLSKKREVPSLADDEVAVSGSGLSRFFVGTRDDMARNAMEILGPVPAHESEKEQNVNEVVVKFAVRRNGTRFVWAFKLSDAERVAKLLNVSMKTGVPELGDDEVAVSGRGLSSIFVGTKVELARDARDILGSAPAHEEERDLNVGGEVVKFAVRRIGTRFVWAFKLSDAERVGKLLKVPTKTGVPELGDDEVAVSPSGLSRIFVGTRGDMVRNATKILGPVPAHESEKEHNVNEKVVTFAVRRSGTHFVWAFKLPDAERVAKLLNVSMKTGVPELGDDEVAVSGLGLSRIFVGSGQVIARDAREILDPVPAHEAEKDVNVGEEVVQFAVRRSGVSFVWAFKLSDAERVAKLLNVSMKTGVSELGEDEVAVSASGLSQIFIGDGGFIASKAAENLGHVPAHEEERDVNVGEEIVRFAVRRRGPRFVWAFKLSDAERVAKLLNVSMKTGVPELGDDEVAVTGLGFSRIYIGDNRALAIKAHNVLGPVPRHNEKIEEDVDGEKVRFFVRRKGPSFVWAFQESDTHLVARLLGVDRLREDDQMILEKLEITDAMALLGNDPLRLYQYISLYHPELSTQQVERLVAAGLRGLSPEFLDEAEELHVDYSESLGLLDLDDVGQESSEVSFQLSGRGPPGTEYVQVTGAYTRRIAVREDGGFSARIPLPRIGEANSFQIYAVNTATEEKSPVATLDIHQTGQRVDEEEALLRLLALKEDVLERITQDPDRHAFLLRSVEQGLLRHFTYDEQAGLSYLAGRIKTEESPLLKGILQTVLSKFREIVRMKDPLTTQGQRLYFFQKYIVHELRALENGGAPGVIVALEQGLGKTVIALVFLGDRPATILTPNPVVSSWVEQGVRLMPERTMTILDGPYKERESQLDGITTPQVLTNIEFTRGMNENRIAQLSQPNGYLVVDEADYLGSRGSQQAMGTRRLSSRFGVLLTATPFKRPGQIPYLLDVFSGDGAAPSSRAFTQAFRVDTQEGLNALFLLLRRYTLRVRKRDVFEEYDPTIPAEGQRDRLPRKVEMPLEEGDFDLMPEQVQSILELFTDYQAWCRKHKGHESREDVEYYRAREGFFSKREALRQIMNDPAYVGHGAVESPKHKAMDRIVEKELEGDPGRKVIIFCRYRAQVEAYLKRYARFGAASYYGGTSEREANRDGYRVDEGKKLIYYAVDDRGGYRLDGQGRPIVSDKENGKPMSALDYQRILFQNNPDTRIIVATYDAGSVGVTLTAADAVIFDDLAPTYRDEYQAADRAHRIDNARPKHEVRYYWLQARYPSAYLDSLTPEVREQYFGMGTYDQVHYAGLRRQRRIFHRIMDGIGSDDELRDWSEGFLRDRMPFMFDANGGNDQPVQEEQGPEANDEVQSPVPGTMHRVFPLLSWVEESVHWVVARLLGLEVAEVGERAIRVPFVWERPLAVKSILLAASAPMFWLGLALVSAWILGTGLPDADIQDMFLSGLSAGLVLIPSWVMVIFHIKSVNNPTSDLSRVLRIIRSWRSPLTLERLRVWTLGKPDTKSRVEGDRRDADSLVRAAMAIQGENAASGGYPSGFIDALLRGRSGSLGLSDSGSHPDEYGKVLLASMRGGIKNASFAKGLRKALESNGIDATDTASVRGFLTSTLFAGSSHIYLVGSRDLMSGQARENWRILSQRLKNDIRSNRYLVLVQDSTTDDAMRKLGVDPRSLVLAPDAFSDSGREIRLTSLQLNRSVLDMLTRYPEAVLYAYPEAVLVADEKTSPILTEAARWVRRIISYLEAVPIKPHELEIIDDIARAILSAA